MVHRPADSRLLTNLLSHEKDYAKHLVSLLDYSHASLSSFTAYAAASSPPASQVILSVAGSLASADDALRRYAASVDQWREMMKNLKSLEDEVGNIMRDREILVTRLIKASKSQKPPNQRESLILSNQRYPSSSSLSVHDSPTTSPGTGPAPGTYAPGLNTSSKLAAAQAELQACEAHLASKEQELATRRNSAIKDGLTIRCTALAECGWTWSESGKDALKTLEILANNGNKSMSNGDNRLSLRHSHSVPLPQTFIPSPEDKPLPPPAGSDVSSIGPSQSASQVNLTLPPPVPPPPVGGHLNYSNGDTNGSAQGPPLSGNGNAARNSYQDTHKTFHIPPAHAIDELTMPTSSAPARHVLSRRITEEEISRHEKPISEPQEGERRSWVNQLDIGHNETDNGSESEDEAAELARGELAVVENPRYAPPTPPDTNVGAASPAAATRVQTQSQPQLQTPTITMTGPAPPSPVKEKVGSFLGSLKGFFGGKTAKDRVREREIRDRKRADSDDELVRASEEEEARTLHARLGRAKTKAQADAEPGKGLFGRGSQRSGGGWETRTDKNLRKLARRESDEDLTVPIPATPVPVREPAFEPVLMDGGAGAGAGPSKHRGRGRVVSDAMAGTGVGKSESVGPAAGGKKLRKQRGGRSSSVPPASPTPPSAPAPVPVAPRIVRPGESDGEEKVSPTRSSSHRAEEWVEKQTAQNTRANAAHPHAQPSAPGPSRVAAGGGKGSSNIPSPTTPTPGVTRRKSLNKPGNGTGKTASGLAPAVMTTGGALVTDSSKPNGDAGLSRNSSILSATSTPATTLNHQRSASASATGTAADFGRVQTPTGLGMGMPTTSVGRRLSGSGPHAHARPTHRRSISVDLSGGGAGNSNVSVTRTASTSATAGRNGGGTSRSSAAPSTPRKPAEMEIIKAPPRVGRQDIINFDQSTATRNIMMMEVPKAPRSVVDVLRSGGIEGGSDVDTTHHERRRSIGGTVKEGSASAPDLVGGGMTKLTSSRPVKSPLRSALRNTSRSPSPPVNGTTSPIVIPGTPTAPPSTGGTNSAPPPVPAISPWEKTNGDMKGKGKVVEEDVSSISSYETGHEVFYSDADNTDHEDEPDSRRWTLSVIPPSTAPSAAQSVAPQSPQLGLVPGTSDISTSTASTSTPQPRMTPGFLGMIQDPGLGSDNSATRSGSSGTPTPSSRPQRRKSVRVSLQPTFSPTPPAIDEDDEEEQRRRAPWVWKGDSVPSSSKQPQNRTGASDVWQDSSDEDVEYQKARRLLSRVAKKEKAR